MTLACPYCRSPFEDGEEQTVCAVCATPHHADCYAENGGCTVFGCAAAPSDEPKISVTSTEVNQPVQALAATAPVGPTPPPPRRAGSTSSVAPPPRAIGYGEAIAPEREINFGGYNPAVASAIPLYIRRRSRLTYILLGVFLGAFGVHNFYAGYAKRAVGQLLLTVLSCFFGGIISWIWAIVEVCTVTQDDDGIAFL
jgi:TM2 domain-containing membrane protein YozV